tara:strand:- start:166 stop:333 length:168 start_codon:yes stop_codon:yes gene_type:complete
MKDCIVKITNQRRQKYWTYELEEYQAIRVYNFIQKITTERHDRGPMGTLAGFYDD